MPNASLRIPKPSRHATGQAVVRLNGRDFYLGKWRSAQAKAAYERLIAEWLAGGRAFRNHHDGPSIAELILGYLDHAAAYYGPSASKELERVRLAMRPLKALYAHLPAGEFGPLALKTVRQQMIEGGLARVTTNQRVGAIKRMFRWAVENQLLPADVHHALEAVEGLRRGRSDARESEPVKPVPEAFVEATLPHVSRQVAAMIRLQLLTGMRPGEVVIMRGCDLDTSGALWTYTPARHKTEHHGHEKLIYLGPQAQAVLKPFLKLDTQAYLFSPREAEAARDAARRRERKSPLWPSHVVYQARKRKRHPKRQPGEHYSVKSYRRAVVTACQKAGVPAWHPHQLRHNAATRLRKELGIEMARCVLGHRSAAITEVYAELDRSKAAEAMLKLG